MSTMTPWYFWDPRVRDLYIQSVPKNVLSVMPFYETGFKGTWPSTASWLLNWQWKLHALKPGFAKRQFREGVFWDTLYTWHTKSPAAGGSPKISLKTRASAHFSLPKGPLIVFAVVFLYQALGVVWKGWHREPCSKI